MKPAHLLLAALLAGLPAGSAAGGHKDCEGPPCTKKICVGEPKTEKVKRPCWEVECKDVCIPRPHLPWCHKCLGPLCGKVRTVHVLKREEREVERCDVKWQIHTVYDEKKCKPCGAGGHAGCPPASPPLPGPTTAGPWRR